MSTGSAQTGAVLQSSSVSPTPPGSSDNFRANHSKKDVLLLAMGALGVVYGDLGTSPLYTIKECFSSTTGLEPTLPNVLGILSLVFWTLMMVVVVKYSIFVMKADNQGEGGIMALLALLKSQSPASRPFPKVLIGLALFGTALLLADGMITPSISVLSAIEGLEIATPVFKPFIVPLTLFVLIILFLVQKKGTGSVASVFGPTMFLWFLTIGLLGLYWIFQAPQVIEALDPRHIFDHFSRNGWKGFSVLGAVILCVTGAEALYADMGHFGRWPIVCAWYFVALPGVILNYFGQGALLLVKGEAFRDSTFYALVPHILLIPMVFLSTIATIIASQALISGAFSLAQQAIQLGYLPRLTVKHTSSKTHGQIYVPEVNTLLMLACCALVIRFENSSNLAAAYGIAVMGTMLVTTILLYQVMRYIWKWDFWKAFILTGIFLIIDVPYLIANLGKIFHGGWVPLVIGGFFYFFMTTWYQGRASIGEDIQKSLLPLAMFLDDVARRPVTRVPGTAIFMTWNQNVIPPVLLHHFTHNKVLHERVVFLVVLSETIPEVPKENRVEIRNMENGFYQIIAHYGFMESPHVPEILENASGKGFPFNMAETSFYLGRESLIVSIKPGLPYWRKWLFCFISRNARPATAFFSIPPNRVLELGTQIEV